MRGSWIPVRIDLLDHPRLVRIARTSSRSRHEVLGLLVHFWAWASCQTVDGYVEGLTVEDLADLVGADLKFWRAVEEAGWLESSEAGLIVPRASWWLGNGSKARILKNQRQARWREGRRSRVAHVDAPEAPGFCNKRHSQSANFEEAGCRRSGGANVDGEASTNQGKTGESGASVDGEGVADVGAVVSTKAPTRLDENTNTPLTPHRGEERVSFDRFWWVYPKKLNREAALRAWESLAPDAALVEAILAALKDQARSEAWRREDGRFIPQPARWLRDRRWEDEQSVPAQPAGEPIEARLARQKAEVEEVRRQQEASALRPGVFGRLSQGGGWGGSCAL